MLSLRLFRPGVPKGREEKAFWSIKWSIHLIDGAVQRHFLLRGYHKLNVSLIRRAVSRADRSVLSMRR